MMKVQQLAFNLLLYSLYYSISLYGFLTCTDLSQELPGKVC